MKNYHDTYGSFPTPAVYDDQGCALLSWRVLLLPFIEHRNLFDRFRLDEAWNSPHNSLLLSKMPEVFNMNPEPDDLNATHFQVIVGSGAAFEHRKALSEEDFADGLDQTILIIEARESVPWSCPFDFEFHDGTPLPKLGRKRSSGFHVLWALGNVDFVDAETDEDTLMAWVTRSGHEPRHSPRAPGDGSGNLKGKE